MVTFWKLRTVIFVHISLLLFLLPLPLREVIKSHSMANSQHYADRRTNVQENINLWANDGESLHQLYLVSFKNIIHAAETVLLLIRNHFASAPFPCHFSVHLRWCPLSSIKVHFEIHRPVLPFYESRNILTLISKFWVSWWNVIEIGFMKSWPHFHTSECYKKQHM